MSAAACERCGAADEVSRSDDLGVTLCGPCWDARTHQVTASAVLRGIEDLTARYLVLPGEHEATALALWIAHTHAIAGAHATPYLLLTSPEKRSGKTRAQEVAELLVARPWRVTGASEAAIFRKLAADRPTLLLDEIDAIFGAFSERTEPLRAILNAGNRPGATVARCVGEKGDQVRDFSVYGAKALAGIDTGRIPDTIRDRSITIAMRRKTGAEPVERLRWRDALAEAAPLREELERWGEGAAEPLLAAEPAIPPELDDRAAEAWEPLSAIAEMAGGEWPARARAAAVALSGDQGREEVSLGALLLAAIRTAFADADRMTTADLLNAINGDEELPFGGWRDGKGLDSRKLAKLIRPYGLRPRTIRVGDDANHRGYLREQFADAWTRWLPDPPTEAPQAPRPPHTTDAATQPPLEQADVADVVDVAAISGGVADGAARGGNGAAPEPGTPEFMEAVRAAMNGDGEGCPCDRPLPAQRGDGPWRCERCGLPCESGFEVPGDAEAATPEQEPTVGEDGGGGR